jgi:hypothetical protein
MDIRESSNTATKRNRLVPFGKASILLSPIHTFIQLHCKFTQAEFFITEKVLQWVQLITIKLRYPAVDKPG